MIQEKLEEMRKPEQNSASMRNFDSDPVIKKVFPKPILLNGGVCSKLVTMKYLLLKKIFVYEIIFDVFEHVFIISIFFSYNTSLIDHSS